MCLPGVYAWQQEGTPHGKTISLQSDDFIPQFVPIAQKVHELGARLMVQIGARGTRIEGSDSASGPSPVRFGYSPIVPREMTVDEIRERVSLLGDAIRRAREAGIDAVEIHACTGKLVSMFLSPYSNRRTDEFGGSPARRIRYAKSLPTRGPRPGTIFPSVCALPWTTCCPAALTLRKVCAS